ncbi:MAG: dihydrolipoyl dehydrogenase [Gemmatimonadota bacterium]|nr:MAG: dihydrolipoyl dehydrogenase [Gemmatimonadota bacterium]
MAESKYDLVVIGGGPGGYVAAIRAAQLGMKVACVEKRGALGGTCLNVGCIPSKALLHSTERYVEALRHLAGHGIQISDVKLDLDKMMERKEKVVRDLTKGVEFLFRKNKVDHVQGTGRIAGPGRVNVDLSAGDTANLTTDSIIVATGSEPMLIPGLEVDEERILTSTGALSLRQVPGRMIVIGAGVIGLELGSVWSRLGSEVTVLEFLDDILPGMDREIARQAQRILSKQGLQFRLSSKVTGAKLTKAGVRVVYEPTQGGEAEELEADVVLVAIGRRPYTEGVGLDELGVETDDRGFIRVDERFQTTVPGVYAIGDCIPGPMLAHKAEEDGIACVEMLAGQSGQVNYELVPAVVYTWPEVAGVGKTEEQLVEAGIEYRVGKFPFQANSRARVTGDTEGLVKILAAAGSDRVLGAHIVGPMAGDLLMEAVVAMEFGASAEDLARTIHHHPGTGEAVKEAALAVDERPIHI